MSTTWFFRTISIEFNIKFWDWNMIFVWKLICIWISQKNFAERKKNKQDAKGIQNMSGAYLIGLTFIKWKLL